ncbi:UNVERIFIED_CONTAM: hypothetical protein Sradi_2149700 [Sesamum radiatum]|uniref:Uncharacterized protein n=1 Tax=Sesamum radiatum TaxID=300843 RepID=A0AAW2T0B5_SESRA
MVPSYSDILGPFQLWGTSSARISSLKGCPVVPPGEPLRHVVAGLRALVEAYHYVLSSLWEYLLVGMGPPAFF